MESSPLRTCTDIKSRHQHFRRVHEPVIFRAYRGCGIPEVSATSPSSVYISAVPLALGHLLTVVLFTSYESRRPFLREVRPSLIASSPVIRKIWSDWYFVRSVIIDNNADKVLSKVYKELSRFRNIKLQSHHPRSSHSSIHLPQIHTTKDTSSCTSPHFSSPSQPPWLWPPLQRKPNTLFSPYLLGSVRIVVRTHLDVVVLM